MEPEQLPTTVPPNPQEHRRFRRLLIIALILAPAVLAFFGAMIRLDALAIASPLVGGVIGGVYCGRLAQRFGKTTISKILLALFVMLAVGCAIIGIGTVGCAAGGFKLDLR